MANCGWLMSIVWFLVLILAWPVGFLAGFVYVMVSPFEACCPNTCNSVVQFLLKGVNLPKAVAQKMVKGDGCN
eukprot:m.308400 g.308400  ORF g.308400 m.308400 type:complete len:73 (+) comp43940_c0_seq1:517-735(+)